MVAESAVPATRPTFPSYLLPSLKLPFTRRSSADAELSNPSESTTSTPATTPSNSPPTHNHLTSPRAGARLTRAAADTIRCKYCSSDLALTSQIMSKCFTGRYGRAFLVTPPPPPSEQTLLNIRVGRKENRQLVTGWHIVADINCGTCSCKLGWKYVDAREESQKYKVGKFILETERTVIHSAWEDVDTSEMEASEYESRYVVAGKEDSDEIVFDSDDEDECDDVFAGIWDPAQVARRRSQTARSQDSYD